MSSTTLIRQRSGNQHGLAKLAFSCAGISIFLVETRLILARLRFESKGGRLPGSGGQVLALSPNASLSGGKKRALPFWGGGGTASGASSKKTLPPKAAPPAGLFKPSYSPTSTSRVMKEGSPVGVGKSKGSERWTPEMVLRKIHQAGPSGATFEVTKYIKRCKPL